ncbi:MAG: hypothetical protein Q7O66_09345 [Dehalococcoidia bacterium]|nr:hypothetical protein [Dehalococcoidia bacterium]
MTVWTIGLAFLVFWSIAAVGLYIVHSSVNRLRQSHPLSRLKLSEVRSINAGESVLVIADTLLLLLGLVLVFEGFWLSYTVVFR